MSILYAQTNIQLFNQLLKAGYSRTDLVRVRKVYELAMDLFGGTFRASGKTFLAHAVGTASILGSLHARPEVIAAGLLHATYTYGEFEAARDGIPDAKRRQVRDAVGREVEDLVARFAAFPWNRKSIPLIHGGLETLSPKYREILLVRLANELEDHLDLGVLYYGNARQRRIYIRSVLYRTVDMAKRIGFPDLGMSLREAFEAVASGWIPSQFKGRRYYPFRMETYPKKEGR